MIACILVFLYIVIPFNQAYRSAARSASSTLSVKEAIDEAPRILRKTMDGSNIAAVLPASADYLMQRIQEIETPAIILQRTPRQIGFLSPAQLVEGPVADLIPRVIWPGKPIVAAGYLISQEYYGLSSNAYTLLFHYAGR